MEAQSASFSLPYLDLTAVMRQQQPEFIARYVDKDSPGPRACWNADLQLINFPLGDHGVVGEVRSYQSAKTAGRRAPRRGHDTGRHRCAANRWSVWRSGSLAVRRRLQADDSRLNPIARIQGIIRFFVVFFFFKRHGLWTYEITARWHRFMSAARCGRMFTQRGGDTGGPMGEDSDPQTAI